MRFIGNKEPIVDEISDLLKREGLLDNGRRMTLFDAFCGTGAVSNHFKDSFDLVVNDLMKWSVVYTKGRITAYECNFEKLGFDPFEYLNSNKKTHKGFFYKNYSPACSSRMYFSEENAGAIDYFRNTIENWYKENLIDENEYSYLLASLVESISFVSNTAGVYGAFLKHWDPRAKKPILLQRVDSKKTSYVGVKTFSEKIENLIDKVDCDILYLDPPYTQNQYGTQYHLLETLVLNDTPSVSKITGSRPTAPLRSDWSKMHKAHVLFDHVIAKTKAKYIIFSYSPDGFMSKSFIEANLKRYGKSETYKCKQISYNKYKNFKSKGVKEHFEYLFFIEKKEISDIYYESPLNYIGSKSKMVTEINKYLPTDIDTFVDIFGGGFNVGINSKAKAVIYNDNNYFVKNLVESFKKEDTYQYLLYVNRIIKKYNLQKENATTYIRLRDYYNCLPYDKRDPKLLYSLILYGFNQQIRFNGNHNFNNPVGMRWFNDKVLEKKISFSRAIKEKNVSFYSEDYTKILDKIDRDSFIYMDPPYRLTTGSYNDGKRGFEGWGIPQEKKLLEFIDHLNKKNVRFMLSYVMQHKGIENEQFSDWVKKNKYTVVAVKNITGIQRKEMLIMNYKSDEKAPLYNQKSLSEAKYPVSGPVVATNIR